MQKPKVKSKKKSYSKKLKSFAKENRNKQTPSEKIFNKRLREGGFDICSQQIIGRYIVDFLIPDKMLIIEIDGGYHNNQIKEDQIRDTWLKRFGFNIIRIPNEYVNDFPLSSLERFPKVNSKYCNQRINLANSKRWQEF